MRPAAFAGCGIVAEEVDEALPKFSDKLSDVSTLFGTFKRAQIAFYWDQKKIKIKNKKGKKEQTWASEKRARRGATTCGGAVSTSSMASLILSESPCKSQMPKFLSWKKMK